MPVGSSSSSSASEPSATNVSLLASVKLNDSAAWSRLFEIYSPLIYRWSRRLGVKPDDAVDVVQEVFRAVAKNVGTFGAGPSGGSFRGWLWTITKNKVHDHFRSKARRPDEVGGTKIYKWLLEVPDASEEETFSSSAQSDDLSLVHDARDLIKAEFEPKTWNAFWRIVVDGQSPADAAADLGMTPGAVRQAKYRVLRRLRQELAGLEEIKGS